jgi:hypothetical protein
MMGDLFVHKNLTPSEIKLMDWPELRYWHFLLEEEVKAHKALKKELDAKK